MEAKALGGQIRMDDHPIKSIIFFPADSADFKQIILEAEINLPERNGQVQLDLGLIILILQLFFSRRSRRF